MSSAINLLDEPILVEDNLPKIGHPLPYFSLVNHDFEDVTLETFKGKRKILHFFPSIDTPVSADSVQKLNSLAAQLNNTVILNISEDLPFALTRFCESKNLYNVTNLSSLRGRDMLKNYGVLMVTSKLAGLSARALIVADENNIILSVELVPELTQEPDYSAAIASLSNTNLSQ